MPINWITNDKANIEGNKIVSDASGMFEGFATSDLPIDKFPEGITIKTLNAGRKIGIGFGTKDETKKLNL